MTGHSKPPGLVEGTFSRLFMKSATVSDLLVLDERFRQLTLSGESLRQVRWNPGQKLQVALGGWVYRTYTPLSWDAATGCTQLLLFLHGDAPGAHWGRALKVGDSCTLFGPRDSLELDALSRPTLLFGDETSLALAHSMRFTSRGAEGVRVVLEVTSKQATEQVLLHLGVSNVDLIERQPDDSHLSEVEQLVADHVQTGSVKGCALTGKASSIQRLNKQLRALGLSSRELRTRAYWAPGKVGLD